MEWYRFSYNVAQNSSATRSVQALLKLHRACESDKVRLCRSGVGVRDFTFLTRSRWCSGLVSGAQFENGGLCISLVSVRGPQWLHHQSVANASLYQAPDVQEAVFPIVNRHHGNRDVPRGPAAHPTAHGQDKGLLQVPTRWPPTGTPLALPSGLRSNWDALWGFYSTSDFII